MQGYRVADSQTLIQWDHCSAAIETGKGEVRMAVLDNLSWVCTIGIVGDHTDGHVELWELDKGLILVCANIELCLDDRAKGRAQFPQLLLCGFIGQVPDMQHL